MNEAVLCKVRISLSYSLSFPVQEDVYPPSVSLREKKDET